MKNFGLKELPKDNRDFRLGNITVLPALKDLPDKFVLETLSLKDQKESDFCSAMTTCLMSEVQEGVELEPSWSFAVSKDISGDKDQWGQDMRTAFKAHVQYGGLPKKDSPFSLENRAVGFLRDINNWPDLKDKALPQKKKAFFFVTGPYDHFDNIRASIFKFQNEKRLIALGVMWSWAITQYRLENDNLNGSGHMIACLGWDGDYLVLQNSYGPNAGQNGRHLLARNVVNNWVDKYGAGMFLDMPKEDALWYLDNGIKLEDNWVIQMVKIGLSFIKSIFSFIIKGSVKDI